VTAFLAALFIAALMGSVYRVEDKDDGDDGWDWPDDGPVPDDDPLEEREAAP